MTERAKKLLLLYYKQSRKIRRVSGLPPLTFKAKKAGTLKNYRIYGNTETKTRSYSGSAPLSFPITNGAVSNYRIYGNTENGESVGDRTGNLFDGKFLQGYWAYADGARVEAPTWVTTPKIPCIGNAAYTFSFNNSSRWAGFVWYDVNSNYISTKNRSSGFDDGGNFTATSPSNAAYMVVNIAGYPDATSLIAPSDVTDFMLVEGTTPLPYEPYGYRIPITNNSETANIYLNEPLRMVGDEAEYIDYAEQKQHRVRKNLLQNTATSQTISGVTVTVNSDYSVTFNGTTSKTIEFHLIPPGLSLPAGKYRLTGTPPSGSVSSYYLRAWYSSSGSVVWINDPGNGIDFTLTDTKTLHSSIVIRAGQILDNITFYPMIRKSDIEDDTYEPYIENTDLDVTLPALPVLPGTNTLTVGTEVQPSSVAVEVDEVVSCGDRTENLFDPSKSVSGYVGLNGNIENSDKTNSSDYIGIIEGLTYTLTLIRTSVAVATTSRAYAFYDIDKHFITPTETLLQNADTITTQINVPQGAAYFRFSYDKSYGNIMFNVGSTDLPYEPYGYKTPVTLTADSAETTDIYLDEPLAKSGNNADYIDYATQKRHNSDGTESSITLPAISTLAGTNTLTVGTEVQPSSVEIKGRIKAAGGD